MEIPLPPEISKTDLNKCRETGDYCPVLFEWYKYVSQIANFYASIQLDSLAIKKISKIHHSVLIGLLNRCARLMFSNVALSHEGLFGETTSIIDRSIFESAIKLSWLCHKGDEDSFNRLIAEGLKTEVQFKKKIVSNIALRKGKQMAIEKRMLNSIENYIQKSEISEEKIVSSKKIPDLASMIEVIGHDRLAYIVGQKIGSHHVHGTWVSLWFHYLEEEDGIIHPRGHDVQTHVNQYAYIPLIVLDAIKAYINYVFIDEDDAKGMSILIDAISKEIQDIYQEVVGSDNEIV
ncbi:MAG: hypothetical protein COA47_14730 [Robiginitomaculum sp.]|nr:MAG: hypothetical protein COA47_14730 [Robiginitomaculum sp.]